MGKGHWVENWKEVGKQGNALKWGRRLTTWESTFQN
jgi:hypothetical protein